jgi:hypothetical protein
LEALMVADQEFVDTMIFDNFVEKKRMDFNKFA